MNQLSGRTEESLIVVFKNTDVSNTVRDSIPINSITAELVVTIDPAITTGFTAMSKSIRVKDGGEWKEQCVRHEKKAKENPYGNNREARRKHAKDLAKLAKKAKKTMKKISRAVRKAATGK